MTTQKETTFLSMLLNLDRFSNLLVRKNGAKKGLTNVAYNHVGAYVQIVPLLPQVHIILIHPGKV